jgi:DNA-binding transcriptional ArsR family regulator
MHALDVLGEPIRRRIVEILAHGDGTAGDLATIVQAEFGVSQPAVSQHLKVLRESGLVSVTPEGRLRRYRLERQKLAEVDAWLASLRSPWDSPLDALATEIARGKRQRRLAHDQSSRERNAG